MATSSRRSERRWISRCFAPELNAALAYSDGAQGGRPPFDPVMMFKILVIQATNNLSDERTEFLINDRLSFMRFLGLGLSDRVPDARTIWLFREKLTKAGAIGPLFERFDATLRHSGYIAMSGQIVDASLIAAPRQRNTEDEKKAIKEGRIPDDWKDKPAKLRQKDRDARWTVKFTKAKPREDGSSPPVDLAIPVFGYQNHISIDRGFGFIRKWSATDAAAYEGAPLARRASRQDQYGERGVGRHGLSIEGQRRVHGKERLRQPRPSQEAEGARHAGGDPRANNVKSKIRSRVEHVFAAAEGSDGPVHPHHRDRAGDDEDRTGEPRLQHQTLAVPAAHRGGIAPKRRRCGKERRASGSQRTKSVAKADQRRSGTRSRVVDRSVQFGAIVFRWIFVRPYRRPLPNRVEPLKSFDSSDSTSFRNGHLARSSPPRLGHLQLLIEFEA